MICLETAQRKDLSLSSHSPPQQMRSRSLLRESCMGQALSWQILIGLRILRYRPNPSTSCLNQSLLQLCLCSQRSRTPRYMIEHLPKRFQTDQLNLISKRHYNLCSSKRNNRSRLDRRPSNNSSCRECLHPLVSS